MDLLSSQQTRRTRRYSRALVALVMIGLLALPGCQTAKAGARCRTKDWGADATSVYRCVKGRWRRSMSRRQATQIVVALINASKKPPMGSVVRPLSLATPQLPNTADPSVLVDGGVTYVYATTTFLHVPVVAITDLDAVHTVNDMYTLAHEAMPQTPSWASTNEIWAPTVAKVGGRFVMYFAAHRSGAPDANSDQCVGRAVASSPSGPFVADATPASCGNNGISGALDPSIFIAPDGAAHLLVAMGGSATNIFSFPLNGDGMISGVSVALLTRAQPWQDWFLENPSMFYDGSTYLLAYSAGHWESEAYMTGIARCATPTGPCTDRSDGPWISSAGARSGPGGLEFFRGADGAPRVAYHSYAAGDAGTVGKRSTTITRFFTDPWPRLG